MSTDKHYFVEKIRKIKKRRFCRAGKGSDAGDGSR
jgi:hypothetical protein